MPDLVSNPIDSSRIRQVNSSNKLKDIDLQHLRCLVALAEAGSATLAAQQLGVSQPSVSHMLQRLRLAFGDALLVRVGLRMVPTPRAQEIAAQARELLAAAQKMLTPIPPSIRPRTRGAGRSPCRNTWTAG